MMRLKHIFKSLNEACGLRGRGRRYVLASSIALSILAGCDDITGTGDVQELWFTSLRDRSSNNAMAHGDHRFYLGFADSVFALDATNGEIVWAVTSPTEYTPDNLTYHDGLILGAAADAFALDAATGSIRWVAPLPALASLAKSDVGGGTLVAATLDQTVHAFDVQTGDPVWTTSVGIETDFEIVPRTVRIHDEVAYIGGLEELNVQGGRAAGWLLALDLQTGTRLWFTRFMSADSFHSIHDGPVEASGRLLVTDFFANTIHAVDPETGAIIWSRQGSYPAVGSVNAPAVGNGFAYVASGDTYLYALDLATGGVRWRVGMQESLDDVVYCGRHLFVIGFAMSVHDPGSGRLLDYLIPHGDEHFVVGPGALLDGVLALPVEGGVRAFRCD